MQFSLAFSSLLVSVIFLLVAQQQNNLVDAAPLAKRKPKTVTLPIKRVPRNNDIHPLVALQQHINRADRRLARMTRRQEPSTSELAARLEKRVFDLHEAGHIDRRDKRYNRIGTSKSSASKRYFRTGLSTSSSSVDSPGSADSFLVGHQLHNNGGGRGNHKTAGNGNTKGNATGNGNTNANSTSSAASSEASAATSSAASGASGNSTSSTGATAGGDIGGPDSENDIQVANEPTADNSLGLNIESQDVGYLSTIPMGTPPQNFLILMDSGSADLWVGSENCQGDQGGDCGNHQFLGPTASSSFQDSNQQFQITYGTGAVAGTIVQDNIDVAGLQLEGHTFGVADVETVDFSDDSTPFDGLMGLAQSTLSNQQTLTPVEALAKAGQIDAAITSYKISRAADNANDGEITFGALDETKFDSATLVELDNVSQDGFWEADMDGVSVDGTDAGLQGRTAIVDTGTTLIIAPAQDATTVLSAVDGAAGDATNGFTVPCDTTATVSLTFGGQTFDIKSEDLATGQPVSGNNCLSGIQAGNIGGANEWLVGDVFLKNAYFSTDVDKNTLSLAKLV